MKSDKDFCLLAASDIHGCEPMMKNIIKYLNSHDEIDAGILLGDVIDYVSFYEPGSVSWYTETVAAARKPFMTIVGNHDTGNNADPSINYADTQELYRKLIRPNIGFARSSGTIVGEYGDCWYYCDFPDARIRFILLNQFDHDSTIADSGDYLYRRNYSMFSQEQIDDFIDMLATVPCGYRIFVCLHNSPALMVPEAGPLTSRLFDFEFSCKGYMEPAEIIADIVELWIKGEKGERSYKVNPEGRFKTITASADFTRRGKGSFIAYLGGHYHNTICSHVKSYPGQKMYSVDVAGMDAHSISYTSTKREYKTVSEDCFVLIRIDADNNMRIERIGATEDNPAKSRKDLGGSKVS